MSNNETYREMNLTIISKVLKVEALCKSNQFNDLEFGVRYRVEEIEMGQTYTDIYLYGKRKSYNSIHFEFYVNGRKCDIYESVAFNPYLSIEKPFIKYI